MKINKLEKNETGKIINIDVEMSDQESAFFIGFAFNTLMKQGILRINELNEVAFDQKALGDTVVN